MIRAIESCHAWLEELAWHTKVTPGALNQPSVGARIAFVKVQAGRVRLHFPQRRLPTNPSVSRCWNSVYAKVNKYLAGKSDSCVLAGSSPDPSMYF
jgi:hypothetical protein